MSKCLNKLIMVSVVVLLIGYTAPAHAQGMLNLIGADNINIILAPDMPKPNTLVYARAESFLVNLDGSTISWYVNGELIKQGLGEKAINFTNGPAGQTTIVRAVIQMPNGFFVEKTKVLKPINMALVWEADSYTPPFYKGKALHPPMGDLRIIAMPDGNVKNYVYKWRRTGKVLQNESGTGKNILRVTGSVLGRAERIDVEVSTTLRDVVAKGVVRIPTTNPFIVVYQKDPVLGELFNRAIAKSLRMKHEEVVLEAFPIFFSVEDRSSVTYSWDVDRNDAGLEPNVVLRSEVENASSMVEVEVKNPSRLPQFNDFRTQVTFGEMLGI